jgi:hypothetical protein
VDQGLEPAFVVNTVTELFALQFAAIVAAADENRETNRSVGRSTKTAPNAAACHSRGLAHNRYFGDAGEAEMDKHNIGQLIWECFAEDVALIGLGIHAVNIACAMTSDYEALGVHHRRGPSRQL